MNKREEERLRRQKEKLEKEIVRTEAMYLRKNTVIIRQYAVLMRWDADHLQVRLLPELSYYQRIIRFCILMIRRNYQKRSGKSCMK